MNRRSLISRLPDIWLRLDSDGFLDRYLQGFDAELDRLIVVTKAILASKNATTIEDKYLRLLGENVGHRWNEDKPYNWNRQKIESAITIASYKGTTLAIEDLLREHGASSFRIIDNASLVDIWNVNNGMFFDADFFHPGVFQIIASQDLDIDSFLADFEYIKQAGSRWYYRISPLHTEADITMSAAGYPRIRVRPGGELNPDMNWWWNYKPQPPVFYIAVDYLDAGPISDPYEEIVDSGTVVDPFVDAFDGGRIYKGL